MTCEGVLFTPPVHCSRLPSPVNDLATTNFLKSSASFQSTATMRYWKKKTNATFGIDQKGLGQVALLQIRGGDICAFLPDLFSEIF